MASTDAGNNHPEPGYAKKQDRAKVPYYITDLDPRTTPEIRELLEKYSHVPPEQQSEHIHRVRDQAWDIRAYPCIGLGAFLSPQLCRHPKYSEVLQRVKDGKTLIDVGTFIGHDLRRLAFDGAPTDKLYGIDIVNTSDVAYEFFRDRETFKGHFIETDFMSTTSPELTALKGQADVVVVSQLLHQWDWQGQLNGAKALSSFTKPGSMVVGNQIGNPEAQEVSLLGPQNKFWRHNPESFAKMWKEVGAATGTTWETEAWLRTFEDLGLVTKDAAFMEPGNCIIEFVAKRTA